MSFEPVDPLWEQRLLKSFANQITMSTLGMTIARVAPGEIELTMPASRAYSQQHGFLHGGIVATGLDTACGFSSFSLMPADAAVLTIEFKTSFLAPSKGARFTFLGRVIKPGRTITVAEATAYAHAEIDGPADRTRPLAMMSATMMTVLGRPGLKG